MYFPLNNTCAEMVAITDKQTTESLYGFRGDAQITPGTDNVGTLWAIAVDTGETVWKYEQRAGMMSLLSTAGGLIFGGDTQGRFRAFDQDNGEVVWEVNLGSAVTGYPVTFSVDGRQYVAASTGTSLTSGGLNQLTPELRTGGGNNLFVFALPVY
jgi:alcohol dehydrogenase (cytochrome c)